MLCRAGAGDSKPCACSAARGALRALRGRPCGWGPAVWQGGAVSVERVVAAGSPGPFRVQGVMLL